MNHHKFSKTSERRLQGIHPNLVLLMTEALKISLIDFGIACGIRTIEEQQKCIDAGTSRILNSAHLHGGAVDVYGWCPEDKKALWDHDTLWQIYSDVQVVAKRYNIPFIWGGNFESFPDAPHFELLDYPQNQEILEKIRPFLTKYDKKY